MCSLSNLSAKKKKKRRKKKKTRKNTLSSLCLHRLRHVATARA